MPDNRYSRLRGRALVWSAVVLVLAAAYVALRFTTIIGEPRLILAEPAAGVSAVSASTLAFKGTVKNGDSLTLNGSSVPLDQDGAFDIEIVLRPGPNRIELRAKKILGREITLTREIYYDDSQIIERVPDVLPAAGTTTAP